MKLSRLEKRFMALTLALAMMLCLMPAVKKADAAVVTTAVTGVGTTDTAVVSRTVNYYYQYPYNTYDSSEDKVYGDYLYQEDGNGNVVITGYKGNAKKVTIPSKIGNKAVIGIMGTFKDNKTVTDVVLPSSVVRIEYEAFNGATNLVNVNLDNVKRIGTVCFDGCESLGDIVLPECLVDFGGFGGAHFKSLTVSNYLAEHTGGLNGGFGKKVEIDNLKFKDGVKKIWMNFVNIKTPVINIPDTVTDLRFARFGTEYHSNYRQTQYGKVVIGSGVTEITQNQFKSTEEVEVILGKNVKIIDAYAFDNSYIKSLVIPDSVTEIQYMVFKNTTNLESVTFSKNLTKVVGGYDGFMKGSLWYDKQKNGVVYTGGALYAYKGSVPKNTTINVKSGTKGIAYMALQAEDASGKNITKVTLPDGLLYIGGVSFFNTGISNISIPETVTEIGPGAFGNTNLKAVYIPKSVNKIGDYAFGYKNDELKNNGAVWIVDDLITKSGDESNLDYTVTYQRMNEKNQLELYESSGCINWGAKRIFDFSYWDDAALFGTGDSTYTGTVHKANKVSGFTIIGYKGSAAEKYAKANGFTFVEAKDGIYQENGSQVYYKNNASATSVTDVVKDSRSGKWYNVVKGKVVAGPTVAKNSLGWWYINKNGVVDFGYTGLAKNANGWWYIKNGKLDFGYTGLAKYNGSWWYVKNGKLDFGYTGLAKYNGSWWYVKTGKVDFGFTGLCKYNGSWWYVKNGKLDFGYTGLAKYNGSWWYVKTGKVDFGFTGLCKYNGSWWYVKTGKVDFGYNSLCKYNGSWWYIKGGKVNFGYTGTAKYNGKTFNVKNGKVVF